MCTNQDNQPEVEMTGHARRLMVMLCLLLNYVLAHCKKWNPVYEAVGVLGVLFAIIFGGLAINQTAKSLIMTQKSVELQEKEFRLRNRPVVFLTNPSWGETAIDTSGTKWPHTIAVEIKNAAEMPAMNVLTVSEIILNGSNIPGSTIDSGVAVIGADVVNSFFLTENIYRAATNGNNTFEAILTTTYGGMLGEKSDAYKSVLRLRYFPLENRFKFSIKEIK